MNCISRRKHIVDTDVVNDVTCTRQSVITRVVIRFYDMTLATEYQRRHMINVHYSFILAGNESIVFCIKIKTCAKSQVICSSSEICYQVIFEII